MSCFFLIKFHIVTNFLLSSIMQCSIINSTLKALVIFYHNQLINLEINFFVYSFLMIFIDL